MLRIALLGAYPILPFAKELRIKNPPKNISSFNVNLARGLASVKDNEVHYFTFNRAVSKNILKVHNGVYVHYLYYPWKISFLSFFQYNKLIIHRELKKIRPDIVHGLGTEHEYPYIAVTAEYPHVITVDCIMKDIMAYSKFSLYLLMKLKIFLLLERFTLNKTRYIVGTTDYMKEKIKAKNAHLFTIHPCINSFYFTYKSQGTKMKKEFVFIGRISPEKGIEHAVRAISRVREKEPNIQLIIIYNWIDNNYLKNIKQLIAHLSLSSNITFFGIANAHEIAEIVSAAVALVLPSNYDAFGLVLAESMALGTPVIASKVGGVPYVVKHGETGFLVEPGDVEALAEKMLLLLQNKKLREQMGKKGKEEALRRFHPDIIAQKTMGVYKKAVNDWRN